MTKSARKKAIIVFLSLLSFVVLACAFTFWASQIEMVEPESKPEPQSPKTWYEYSGIIFEIFSRGGWKFRPYGALTTDATLIQFYKEAYVVLKVGDQIKIRNWSGNWQSKRIMEVYRNGTFLGDFLIWFT